MRDRTDDQNMIPKSIIPPAQPLNNPNASQETLDFGVACKDSIPNTFNIADGDRRNDKPF